MDFIEARNGAAREIALAFGVPEVSRRLLSERCEALIELLRLMRERIAADRV